MAIKRTYLDYNASAPLLPQAREAMLAALACEGNASSVHAEGRRLRAMIEAARDDVASLVGAKPADVVFTSGATEANVTVLSGGWDSVFVAGIEHDSVLAPVRASGARLIGVPVHGSGVIDAGAIAARVLKGFEPYGRAVIALQLANNETGVVQPVAEVAAFAREHGMFCHSDGVQAAGRLAIDFDALGVDTLAISAHKIGGPKGVGALVIRDGATINRFMSGGGQERRRRAGTENVAGIAGFGVAARLAVAGLAEFARLAALRDRLERGLLALTPQAVVFGALAERLGNTTCVGVPGMAAEIVVIKLDMAGFAVSAGSACSSGKVGASHVLAAMGAEPEAARGAIRISLGPASTAHDVDAFLGQWLDIHRGQAGRAKSASEHFKMSAPVPLGRVAVGE